MRISLLLSAVFLGNIFACLGGEALKERHVVVMVWDAMRPDFVSEQNTPTLYQLAQEGVRFQNHHAAYLSSTEVNCTAIATGAYPANSGIVANKEYRPEIETEKMIHMESLDDVRKGDVVSRGHYIKVPTIAEILHEKHMKTAVAGAKPVALLQDRAERLSSAENITLFEGRTLPANAIEAITNLHGEFPKSTNIDLTRDDWTTQALIDPLWKDGVPEFTLLWLSEPDRTQHLTGPGSEKSLAAIKSADANLARVLRALDAKGVRSKTDILIVSDHGCSTVLSQVDVADSLRSGGFKAMREWTTPPVKDDIIVVGNGGSAMIYVIGHDQGVIRRAVKYLQERSFAGVIFTRKPVEGTFRLGQVLLDAPTAPDIVLSMRWTANTNDVGTPGTLISDLSEYGPGQGMHVSLSRFDMHNTLIAAGPDFRNGVVDQLPSGNVDIAPTLLWILGIKPPKSMDGRILSEALTIPGPKLQSYEPGHLETTADLEKSVWHQYLNFTKVNGVVYVDEGNGNEVAK